MRTLSIATSAIMTITGSFLFRHLSLHAEPIPKPSTLSNSTPDQIAPTRSAQSDPLAASALETAVPKSQLAQLQSTSRAAHLEIQTISQQAPITQSAPITPAEPDQSPIPSLEEVEALEQELDSFQAAPEEWDNGYRGSPGITLSVPSGFGSDRGRTFVSGGVQRTRFPTTDGAVGFGIGLGNSTRAVGMQLSYTVVSLKPGKRGTTTSDRPFGSGALNVKIHRQFPGGWSAAVGADGLVNIGKTRGGNYETSVYNEFENTYYGVVTRIVPLQQNINRPFSRLALTVGAGSGRFRTEKQILRDRSSFIVNPFASAALRVTPSTSLIVEWTAQDLGVGLSIVPFRNLPLVLTPAIRDLAGPDAEKPRFIFGVGLSL